MTDSAWVCRCVARNVLAPECQDGRCRAVEPPITASRIEAGNAAMLSRLGIETTVCRVNRCGRPLGIGTHMSIAGYGRAADQTIPVCEDHWQALRGIFPSEGAADA